MANSPTAPNSEQETAEQAMERILDGYALFREKVFPDKQQLFKKLAGAQNPKALFITCADSRVVPDLITQSSPGDLFVIRNVGNIVPPYGQMNGGVSTAIEYAVLALGVKHIIVCGHSDCGAMRAVLNPASLEHMPTVRAWLWQSEAARIVVEDNCPDCTGNGTLPVLTEENVVSQLDHLCTHPSVASRLAAGKLFIHGWVYDIETGAIRAYDAAQGKFREIEAGSPLPIATPKPRYPLS